MSDEINIHTGRVSGGRRPVDKPPVYVGRRSTNAGRTMPSAVALVAVALLTGSSLIAYEKFAPMPWKISFFLGTVDAITTNATKAGELQAQAQYEPVMLQMKAVYEQDNDRVKAALQMLSANCQATYDVAKIYAQAVGGYRLALLNAHLDQVNKEQSFEVGIIAGTRGAGLIGNLIRPGMGQGLYERVRPEQERLSQELDDAARQGLAAEIDGWDEGIATPEECLATVNSVQFTPMPEMPVIGNKGYLAPTFTEVRQ